MSEIIRVRNLFKTYGTINAVNDLSFTVSRGEVYGFLGQNGAGKSTTIRILLSLVRPTNGEVEVFGMNIRTHRKEILKNTGAIIERPDLYKYLSAYENVAIFSRLSSTRNSRKQIMEQLELVGLAERAESKVKTFSQGMKQRLGLAVALIHNPDLVILDEPTNGLDPQGIADVRNLILHLSRNLRKTVFVSSHLLNEMEMIADRMLILDKGKSVREGSVKDLFDPARMHVQFVIENVQDTLQTLQHSTWSNSVLNTDNNSITFELQQQQIPMLNRFLSEQGALISAVQSKHSLEEYFLSLTTANQHVDPFANRTI
jgi:ABC-2 type transport system ATP-binding protein